MTCKRGMILTTYKSWDDPPRMSPFRKGDEPNLELPSSSGSRRSTLWPMAAFSHTEIQLPNPPYPWCSTYGAPSLKLTANAPENRPKRPKRKFIFQPWIFRGEHVSFKGIPPKKKTLHLTRVIGIGEVAHVGFHFHPWTMDGLAESQGGLLEMEKYHGNPRGPPPKCYLCQEMAGLIEG